MRYWLAWLVGSAVLFSCSDGAREREKIAIELKLSSGSDLVNVAERFRSIHGNTPDALMEIAHAFERDQQYGRAVAVWDELLEKGSLPENVRVRSMEMRLKHQVTTSTEVHQRERRWLMSLLQASPDCYRAHTLVKWSRVLDSEFDEAVELALRICPVEWERCLWIDERADRFKSDLAPDTACELSLCEGKGAGRRDIHERCAATTPVAWKAAYANASLGIQRVHNLTIAAAAADAPVRVLFEFADEEHTTREEACRAMDQAERREVSWISVAGRETTIRRKYQIERERFGCR